MESVTRTENSTTILYRHAFACMHAGSIRTKGLKHRRTSMASLQLGVDAFKFNDYRQVKNTALKQPRLELGSRQRRSSGASDFFGFRSLAAPTPNASNPLARQVAKRFELIYSSNVRSPRTFYRTQRNTDSRPSSCRFSRREKREQCVLVLSVLGHWCISVALLFFHSDFQIHWKLGSRPGAEVSEEVMEIGGGWDALSSLVWLYFDNLNCLVESFFCPPTSFFPPLVFLGLIVSLFFVFSWIYLNDCCCFCSDCRFYFVEWDLIQDGVLNPPPLDWHNASFNMAYDQECIGKYFSKLLLIGATNGDQIAIFLPSRGTTAITP